MMRLINISYAIGHVTDLFTVKGNLVLCCTGLCDSCVHLAMLPRICIPWVFWCYQCLTMETTDLWPLSYLCVLQLGSSWCEICTRSDHTYYLTRFIVIRQDAPLTFRH
jgi:hypothetical protein